MLCRVLYYCYVVHLKIYCEIFTIPWLFMNHNQIFLLFYVEYSFFVFFLLYKNMLLKDVHDGENQLSLSEDESGVIEGG